MKKLTKKMKEILTYAKKKRVPVLYACMLPEFYEEIVKEWGGKEKKKLNIVVGYKGKKI